MCTEYIQSRTEVKGCLFEPTCLLDLALTYLVSDCLLNSHNDFVMYVPQLKAGKSTQIFSRGRVLNYF